MEYIGSAMIILGLLSIIKKRKNNIIVLLSIELILIGIALIFCKASIKIDDLSGIISSIFILTVGAAESAIGLSIIIINNYNNN